MFITFLLILVQALSASTIYDFNKDTSTVGWRVVDDSVMGGLSQGKLKMDDNGNGVYSGSVSLANNGGFSSLRYQFTPINVSDSTTVVLRIKGDGKRYQFRVKDKTSQYHSYITYFETSGEWQTVRLPLRDFYPSFRGRKLRIPNFNHSQIAEVAFLIGNKKAESFELVIDMIGLE